MFEGSREIRFLAFLVAELTHRLDQQENQLMALVTIDQTVLDGFAASLTTIDTAVKALAANPNNNLQPADVSGITNEIAAIQADLNPPAPADPTPVSTDTPPADTTDTTATPAS